MKRASEPSAVAWPRAKMRQSAFQLPAREGARKTRLPLSIPLCRAIWIRSALKSTSPTITSQTRNRFRPDSADCCDRMRNGLTGLCWNGPHGCFSYIVDRHQFGGNDHNLPLWAFFMFQSILQQVPG